MPSPRARRCSKVAWAASGAGPTRRAPEPSGPCPQAEESGCGWLPASTASDCGALKVLVEIPLLGPDWLTESAAKLSTSRGAARLTETCYHVGSPAKTMAMAMTETS